MSSDIGEKIRKRRKALGYTQAQLADGQIPRNMLSLIENGGASPSIKTLEHIAEKLGVSPAYFFVNTLRDNDITTKRKIAEIKELYKNKDHSFALKEIESFYKSIDEMPDEILLLAAECSMQTGKNKILSGAFESGGKYLSKALEYSKKCPFATEWIDANVFIFEAVVENSDCPIQSLSKDYFLKIRRSTGYEYYNYLYAIRLIDDNRGEEAAQFLKHNNIIEPAHKEHINAKFMMLSESKDLKVQSLELMCDIIKRAPSYALDSVTRYLLLKDIEYAARAINNYEMAYKYASMRLKIITDMRD